MISNLTSVVGRASRTFAELASAESYTLRIQRGTVTTELLREPCR